MNKSQFRLIFSLLVVFLCISSLQLEAQSERKIRKRLEAGKWVQTKRSLTFLKTDSVRVNDLTDLPIFMAFRSDDTVEVMVPGVSNTMFPYSLNGNILVIDEDKMDVERIKKNEMKLAGKVGADRYGIVWFEMKKNWRNLKNPITSDLSEEDLKSSAKAKELEIANPSTSKEPVLQTPGILPKFGSDSIDAIKYFYGSMSYPPQARKLEIQGKVVAEFVVEPDGKLSNIRILISPSILLSLEALRLLQNMPNWNPGIQNGKAIRTVMNYPIEFILPD